VFPVRYGLGFYSPEDGILHSHRRENHQELEDYRVEIMSGGTQTRKTEYH
jgi:hypothetical protein